MRIADGSVTAGCAVADTVAVLSIWFGSARAWIRRRGVPAALCALAVAVAAISAAPRDVQAEPASDPGSPAAGQLDLGASFSCAIVNGGQVSCWGYGAEGELGHPGLTTVGATDTPASVGPVDLGAGYTATAISSGDYHSCAIRQDGSVLCWGYGADGRLGHGNIANVGATQTPASAGPVDLGPGRSATAISAGDGFTCAIVDDGSVRCWGYDGEGQLGHGDASNIGDGATNPAGVPDQSVASAGPVEFGAGHTAMAISAGGRHACAILDDGSVRCWGWGAFGQLGYGNTHNVGDGAFTAGVADQSVASAGPVDLGAGRKAVAISAGTRHTCAILDDGSVRCWGSGVDGELGYGATTNAGDTPGSVPAELGPVNLGAGRTAVAIAAGDTHTCAVLDDHTVRCWGSGANGRLGYGNQSNVGDTPNDTPGVIPPVKLGPGRSAIAIGAGGSHTCAILDDGSIRCWGDGANGRLGYCGEGDVGDTPTGTPDTAGPVSVVPGDGGEPCPPPGPAVLSPPSITGSAVVGGTLSERHGAWSPAPTGYAYRWERCERTACSSITGATRRTYTLVAADAGSQIRVLESASGDAGARSTAASAPSPAVRTAGYADALRARGWRICLARARAGGRRRCAQRWGRTPGRVTGLKAIARGRTTIGLEFTAPGTDGRRPPAADRYLVEQSLRTIAGPSAFRAAPALCHGACRFRVAQVGTRIELTVTGLRPHSTYHYSVAALDNVTARPGPRSRATKATTA